MRLAEYQSTEVELDTAAALDLMSVGDDKLRVRRAVRDGWWAITATQHVGTFVSGDFQLVVAPKVEPAELLELMTYSTRRMAFGRELFAYADSPDIVVAGVHVFARMAEQAFVTGMDAQYVERREALMMVRGRLDVPQMLARGGVLVPIPCRYEEMTHDTPRNRLVVRAALAASSLPGLTPNVRASVVGVLGSLEGVPPAIESESVLPDATRSNVHYEPLIELSRLIIRGTSLQAQSGGRRAASFTIDMNKVFEDLVTNGLRRHLGEYVVQAQRKEEFGRPAKGGPVVMYPDVIIADRDGTLRYVVDAKYKLEPGATGKNEDLYQLLAYTTGLDLSEGMLVYARSVSRARDSEVTVHHTDKSLRWRSVSLAGGFDAVDAALAELADEIRRRIVDRGRVKDLGSA